MAKVSDKNFIIPAADKEGNQFNLDFFWLEKQMEKYEDNLNELVQELATA